MIIINIELNKIYNIDCLEGMRCIEDKSIDMILCDLPYGTTACKWDSVLPFDKLWEQYNRIIKDNGAIVLFGSQPFSSQLINSNLKMFKQELIWEKSRPSNSMMAKKQIMKTHENILIFYKKQPTYNPQKWLIDERFIDRRKKRMQENYTFGILDLKPKKRERPIDDGTRYPMSILSYLSVGNAIHPTQKPVELLEYLIKTYTNEGEVVLDNCIGSGSTAIACINTNRNYIGFELDKGYFDIANERIDDFRRSKLNE